MGKTYDLFCKGPFPDGRAGECWVRLGTLTLERPVKPEKDLHVYRCPACSMAEKMTRRLVALDRIPWWDPDYRAAVIAALEPVAQVFPFIKCVDATDRFYSELKLSTFIALGPFMTDRPAPREVSARRRVDLTKGKMFGSGYHILDSSLASRIVAG